MSTISVDDKLLNEVIAVGRYSNAQEAVIKILSDYVQQKKQVSISELLAMSDAEEIDFDPPRLSDFQAADLS